MTKADKRKVLIISWGLPIRIIKFAKHLPKFGWEPVILTSVDVFSAHYHENRDLENVNIITVRYNSSRESMIKKTQKMLSNQSSASKDAPNARVNLLKRTLNGIIQIVRNISSLPVIKEIFREPSDWFIAGKNKGVALLESEKFHLIFSTYNPAVNHMIASYLQKHSKLPWVADFRDLWSLNHNLVKIQPLHFLEKRLEINTMKNSSQIITVSGPLAQEIKMLFGKDINIITNGFDIHDYAKTVPKLEEFTITYTGSIYPKNQDPSPLFQAISELIAEGKLPLQGFRLRFFGNNLHYLGTELKKYAIEQFVEISGHVPFKESIVKQQESTVLLLLSWNDQKQKGVYTSKVFEYLGASRPILAVGAKGSVIDDLLVETKRGILENNSLEIKNILIKWFEEFEKSGGVFSFWSPEIKVEKQYTRFEQAKKLATVFNESINLHDN